MIILDTNVLSEPLAPQPSPAVLAWLDAQVLETLYLTSINTAELWAGIALLPDGQRKRSLESSLETLLRRLFGNRRLPFDDSAAREYATIRVLCRDAGVALSLADGQIAGIARDKGFAVATRDGGPFRAAGITVIDPWAAVE